MGVSSCSRTMSPGSLGPKKQTLLVVSAVHIVDRYIYGPSRNCSMTVSIGVEFVPSAIFQSFVLIKFVCFFFKIVDHQKS